MTKSNPVPPADDVIQQVAQAQDLTFLALAPRSNLVYLVGEMASHITGLTAKCFLPSLYAATDCLLGPVQFDFVTEVDAFGRPRNVAHNVSSYQGVLIAPCVPSPPMNAGTPARPDLPACSAPCPRCTKHPTRDSHTAHVSDHRQDGLREDHHDQHRATSSGRLDELSAQVKVLRLPEADHAYPHLQGWDDADDARRRIGGMCVSAPSPLHPVLGSFAR